MSEPRKFIKTLETVPSFSCKELNVARDLFSGLTYGSNNQVLHFEEPKTVQDLAVLDLNAVSQQLAALAQGRAETSRFQNLISDIPQLIDSSVDFI